MQSFFSYWWQGRSSTAKSRVRSADGSTIEAIDTRELIAKLSHPETIYRVYTSCRPATAPAISVSWADLEGGSSAVLQRVCRDLSLRPVLPLVVEAVMDKLAHIVVCWVRRREIDHDIVARETDGWYNAFVSVFVGSCLLYISFFFGCQVPTR